MEFPIEELKKRKLFLEKNNIKNYSDLLRVKRMQIARDYFETEEGRRELFENRNIELIIEICDFAKKNKQTMVHTIKNGNELYIYINGKLIHKTRTDNSQGGVTFDVMAYRRSDILKSIK